MQNQNELLTEIDLNLYVDWHTNVWKTSFQTFTLLASTLVL